MCRKKLVLWVTTIWLIIFALQITGCIFLYKYFESDENNKIRTRVDDNVVNIINGCEQLVNNIEFNLAKTAAEFRINGIYITQDMYIDLMQQKLNPGGSYVESFVWIPKLPDGNRTQFEEYCKNNILPNCSITELNVTSRSLIPAQKRDYYYPIIFTEPQLSSGNNLIGFDVLSSRSTAVLIETALKNINMTGTIRVAIAQELNNKYSYGIALNYLAIADGNIIGIMTAITNINDLITKAIVNRIVDVTRSDIDIIVFDISNDGISNNKSLNLSLLYKEDKAEYETVFYPDDYEIVDDWTIDVEYRIADRKWKIYFKFLDNYINKFISNNKVIITVCVAAILFMIDIVVIVCHKIYNTVNENIKLEKEKRIVAGRMLNYVNHEIRNPLNVIDGMIDNTLDVLSNRTKDNTGTISFVKDEMCSIISDMQTASGSCEIMRHIVNDILDIRKLEEGKMLLEYTACDISQIVKYIHKAIIPKLREKPEIKFIIDIQDNLDKESIVADKNRLIQILLNLISNAIKFTIHGSIVLRVNRMEKYVKFEVIDTGRGISDNAKHKIFQPFQQVRNEDTTRYGGIGLGLYLCNMLVKLLEGHIGFDSVFEKGTTFWFTLPVRSTKKIEM